jgi:hypothetical protein
MVAWVPILKTSLPFITQIVTAAIPAFTQRPEANKVDSATARPEAHTVDPVTARQIEELQAAATNNAESIRLLAEKLKQTIEGIDAAALNLRRVILVIKLLASAGVIISVGAILIALRALG